jgi:AcrR family transcriptional regulator
VPPRRAAPDRRRAAVKAPVERREELLAAARRAFAERGIQGTTVSDVTEAAGVAKGTFYLYFDSKDALLGAVKQRFVEDLIAEVGRFIEPVAREDWWALADATVERVFDYVFANGDLIQVFAHEGMARDTRHVFAEADERLESMFAFAIKAGMEAGAFDAEDPELYAAFLDHAFHGTLESAILYGRDLDRDRVVAAAKSFIRKALAPSPISSGA